MSEKFLAMLQIRDLNDFMAPSQACVVSVKGLKSINVKKKTPEAPDNGKMQRQSTTQISQPHYSPTSGSSFSSATYHTEENHTFTKTEMEEDEEDGREATTTSNSHCLAYGRTRGCNGSPYSLNDTLKRPHGANDVRWEAIRTVKARSGELRLNHFRVVSEIGSGDVGTVYLTELCGTRTQFAMKVMKKVTLAGRKKLQRAQTEREILMSLDHPFLPMLYTHFETDKICCLVMEFCPGGDLHSLKQRQRGKYFSEHAARFYAAEVLLALEYLHMLGIVYRDLKPENVLVREDGHIMLSDFDLSLRSPVSPTLITTTAAAAATASGGPSRLCLSPTFCLSPRLFSGRHHSSPERRLLRPELLAEPTSARSMSFVGTHEYLAPEIIKGEGHGSAVDWWTFGVFLYELLYGRTPFRGDGNRATFSNVVGRTLRFPNLPSVSYAARDLIWGLLEKDPHHRLAFRRGAAEVKQHSFFQGVNWALIRCTAPPEVPPPYVAAVLLSRANLVNSHVTCGAAADSTTFSGPCSDFDFF